MLQTILDKIWNFFASLKTGIVLISLLALTNLVGSFILQRVQVPEGEIERVYSPTAIKIMEVFDLFDLYHSWWFILLLTVTGVSLIIASIEIWPRYWARVSRWKTRLGEKEFQAQNLKECFSTYSYPAEIAKEKISDFLGKNWARPTVEQEGERLFFFAQRGRRSHLAVFVIHAGLITILLGGFIGMRYGYEGQLRLTEGTASDLFFDRRGRGDARPLGFTVRANDVRMESYPDGSPKAYYSDLDIVENGQVVKSKTIKVNDPLEHNGIYFYQASYGTEPVNQRTIVTLVVEDRRSGKRFPLEIPMQRRTPLPGNAGTVTVADYNPDFVVPVQDVPQALGQAVRLVVEREGQQKNFWIFQRLPNFDGEVRRGDFAFVLKDFKVDYDVAEFTGLAVGHNPGIVTVWTGSGLLLTGILWVIFGDHRKLWVEYAASELRLAGRAHRNEDRFQKKFEKLADGLDHDLAEVAGAYQPTHQES